MVCACVFLWVFDYVWVYVNICILTMLNTLQNSQNYDLGSVNNFRKLWVLLLLSISSVLFSFYLLILQLHIYIHTYFKMFIIISVLSTYYLLLFSFCMGTFCWPIFNSDSYYPNSDMSTVHKATFTNLEVQLVNQAAFCQASRKGPQG